MKRTTLIFLVLLLLLPRQTAAPAAADDVLRLHILASSDSPADQALKLRVRDALLPLFEAEPSTPLMGHDTRTAMMSSAVHGTRFEVEGYIRSLLPRYPDLQVFLTGGNTFQISPDLQSRAVHDPHLLLRGLLSLLY